MAQQTTWQKPLTSQDVADYVGVQVATIRNWTNAGIIKCWKTAGGHRRYELDEAEKLKERYAPKRLIPTDVPV